MYKSTTISAQLLALADSRTSIFIFSTTTGFCAAKKVAWKERTWKLISATRVNLNLNDFKWAKFRSTKGGIKINTRFDYDMEFADYLFISNPVQKQLNFFLINGFNQLPASFPNLFFKKIKSKTIFFFCFILYNVIHKRFPSVCCFVVKTFYPIQTSFSIHASLSNPQLLIITLGFFEVALFVYKYTT